jgi:hypothetical protein
MLSVTVLLSKVVAGAAMPPPKLVLEMLCRAVLAFRVAVVAKMPPGRIWRKSSSLTFVCR